MPKSVLRLSFTTKKLWYLANSVIWILPVRHLTTEGLYHEVLSLKSKKYPVTTVTIWKPNTWIPDSMGVRYSNGKVTWLGGPFEYWTFWTINKFFSLRFSYHPNIGPFDNRTQIYHLNTRLVQYSNGYCIWIPDKSRIWMVKKCPVVECLVFKPCLQYQSYNVMKPDMYSLVIKPSSENWKNYRFQMAIHVLKVRTRNTLVNGQFRIQWGSE